MRRREFITFLGASLGVTAAGWPLTATAQQVAKNWKIGVLHPGQAAAVDARITAIREGLNRPDSKASSLDLVVRLAHGNLAPMPAVATELAKDRVDVITAAGPPAVQAASGATATTPVIAIDLESDPVAIGFIASLARPGRNITGVFLDFPDFSAKCLQLLI